MDRNGGQTQARRVLRRRLRRRLEAVPASAGAAVLNDVTWIATAGKPRRGAY